MLPAASTHIAMWIAHGRPIPVRPDPTNTMISRSGRSIHPPSAVSPLASARAFAYEMTCEVTRQMSVATSSHLLFSW